jgi:hypothetical protein
VKRGAALAFALLLASPAGAYIETLYPLAQFIAESDVIAEGTVEKVDEKTRTCLIKVAKSLKGRCGYETIRVTVGGGQEWHPEAVMRHLKVGEPAVIFYNAERRAELYINRFFCQMYGDASKPPDKAWWTFTHVEVHCNRTFAGTAEELSKTVTDHLSGRAKAPAPDPKLPPITALHLKALSVWGEPTDKLPVSFAKAEPARSARLREPENPDASAPGLSYQYYLGQWTELPDFAALQPAATGVAAQIDLSKRTQDDHFALRFSGFLEAPRDGTYTLTTVSDDGSKLFVGKTEVVSNDGQHAATEKSGEIALKKGRHAITLLYFENEGGEHLEVFWEGPELPRQKISASALSH